MFLALPAALTSLGVSFLLTLLSPLRGQVYTTSTELQMSIYIKRLWVTLRCSFSALRCCSFTLCFLLT